MTYLHSNHVHSLHAHLHKQLPMLGRLLEIGMCLSWLLGEFLESITMVLKKSKTQF